MFPIEPNTTVLLTTILLEHHYNTTLILTLKSNRGQKVLVGGDCIDALPGAQVPHLAGVITTPRSCMPTGRREEVGYRHRK